MKGRKLSEEHNKKNSEAKSQRIICLNDNMIFDTITECVRYYKIPSKISKEVTRGIVDYKNLSFRYVDKEGNVLPIQKIKEKQWIKCSNGKIYMSTRDASFDVGVNHQSIHAVVSMVTFSSMKHTFQWCSLEEVEELLSNGYKLFFKD